MKPRDLILNAMAQAIKENNADDLTNAFNDLMGDIRDDLLREFNEKTSVMDANILKARGHNILTSAEQEYFSAVGEAMKSKNPMAALTDLQVVMPETVIERVLEDITVSHPLLDVVSITNTSGLTKILRNVGDDNCAVWGDTTATIAEELTGGFEEVNGVLYKLSAFLPVAIAMIDLGPSYLDSFIRTLLTESIAVGLELAVVAGTGKNEPIGMKKDISAEVTVTGGVYPDKDTIEVTKFDTVSYGEIVAELATNEVTGKTRDVEDLILVVNPIDYLKKVMPATTIFMNGAYVNDILPLPTTIIRSSAVDTGEAIIGIGKRYDVFLGTGLSKNGRIEYSDDVKFLDDNRVYKVKLYGNGVARDDNSFKLLDISALEEFTPKVYVTNMPEEIVVPEEEVVEG